PEIAWIILGLFASGDPAQLMATRPTIPKLLMVSASEAAAAPRGGRRTIKYIKQAKPIERIASPPSNSAARTRPRTQPRHYRKVLRLDRLTTCGCGLRATR